MKNNDMYDILYKLIIVGESGVGKTCLLLRFTEDTFTSNHLTTIGIDFKVKILYIEDKLIKLQIWYTAGQERFRTVVNNYYKGAHGIILTYDVTNESSFENIRTWVKLIDENAGGHICKVLVGNKTDSYNRRISKEQGQSLADEFKMQFFETSAKNNLNVKETFEYIAKEILNSKEEQERLKNIKKFEENRSSKITDLSAKKQNMNDEDNDNNENHKSSNSKCCYIY